MTTRWRSSAPVSAGEREGGTLPRCCRRELPRYLPEFLGGGSARAHEDGRGYDIVHSHYWLSGWVGQGGQIVARRRPLVASFHTLGKVKNYSLARGEPAARGAARGGAGRDRRGRSRARADADRGRAARRPVPSHPGSVRLVPPGVDHLLFVPGDRARARERLHLAGLASPYTSAACSPTRARRRRAYTRQGRRPRSRGRGRPRARDRGAGRAVPNKGVEVARLFELPRRSA